MAENRKSIKLTSFDDLFSTEESRAEESCEKVVRIPLAELHPFPNHPFHVRDDEAMQNTVDSIKEYGVDEKYFLDTLDQMVEQAFNDQCTGANPRYPLMSEIKEMYLKAYYGK